MASFYESDRAVAEYLLFHYGEGTYPVPPGSEGALGFPARCAALFAPRGPEARALDLGCAVGRSTFEMARQGGTVLGIDYSARFVEAAEVLRTEGEISVEIAEEGDLARRVVLKRPEVDPARVAFLRGDALALPDLSPFDAVLAANLIDRLADPARFLARLPALVRPGGELVLTSPYTWLEDYTPRDKWLGGFVRDGVPVGTRESLERLLAPAFELVRAVDLPFLIREHARKFQWSIAEATLWRRRE
ncbi:putative 4-mercaptohistidine N1-methyltranferase [Verrucomicrobium sp. GAS474]|uniref:putative 4-mercaptohistidine N1-methyltransferase n=1 Tax=Verrucomicrobium sp. GAS474 TaxID=1882831 RepID=UPI000879C5FA|nr:putative 4-mercaptohistidine N1-methyltransferase [Verrucomicrobium sp. GAS474]SDU12523.1 putative 4-mercaptohistidine N1-methyltranferase [Verrucomicrobium sp. GAS474]